MTKTAPPVEEDAIISPVFLREKRKGTGKWRLIIDLRHLNQFCTHMTPHMEYLWQIEEILEEQDWMVTIDISEAFHNISIAESARKYFYFRIPAKEGSNEFQYYQCSALPFGFCQSPAIFGALMDVLAKKMRRMKVRVTPGEAFEDVIVGNTKTSCDSGFPASVGWDPVTGGTPHTPRTTSHHTSHHKSHHA